MLQVLLNIVDFGMSPQAAVEAPRFATASFPNSFEPHDYTPGKLFLERRIGAGVGDKLAALGHGVTWWPKLVWRAGAVCLGPQWGRSQSCCEGFSRISSSRESGLKTSPAES